MATTELDATRSTVQTWTAAVAELAERIGPYFTRIEARRRALAYVQGLVSPAERKNSWQLAEMMADATPYGFQHLLGRAVWDVDALRDGLRTYVHNHLGNPEAVLVIDETGFLKKGSHSAGVARQYSGTAGRIENSQIGVFLAYMTPAGQTLIDRELYLPHAWTTDHDRCQQAGIPETRQFATKPQLAQQMLDRALGANLPAAWVTGDSIYGDARSLRTWLEARSQAYVLAVSGKEHVWLQGDQQRITTILATLPKTGWSRLSAGDGAKGPRWYDWLRLRGADPDSPGWTRWVLVRRNISDPTDVTAYLVFAPEVTPLVELVRVAGSRWAIEVCFEAAKGEVGLDQYQVRSWRGWYRHVTLALWAQALLTVIRSATHEVAPGQKGAVTPTSSSLAACNVRPSGSLRGVSQRSVTSYGHWSSRLSERQPRSSSGRCGDAAIKPWRSSITTNGGSAAIVRMTASCGSRRHHQLTSRT
jgi:SRSO17 transposase